MPQFVTDLLRDLRDRRLLLPAVALLVALIAVPLFLSSSSSPAPAPPGPSGGASAAKATAAEAAVLTEQLGVTNYRKRLEQFKTKNPFRQQFALPEITDKLEQSSVSSTASTGVTSGAGLTPESGGSISASPAVSTSSPGSTPSSSAEPTTTTLTSPSSHDGHPHHNTETTITKLIQRRIDVKVGPEGSLEKREGVRQLTFLPSAQTPVVAFLGASEDGKKALFVVSTDVAAVNGDGVCLSTTPSCQFVALRKDEAETFDYTPDAVTYKLKLLAIRDVVIKKTQD